MELYTSAELHHTDSERISDGLIAEYSVAPLFSYPGILLRLTRSCVEPSQWDALSKGECNGEIAC